MKSIVNKLAVTGLALIVAMLTGCASVPMASKELDAQSKTFAAPAADKAGLYIYRNSFVGKALSKELFIDNRSIGKSANKTFFHQDVSPGEHTISTESEFGQNEVKFNAEGGKNYFARQYIKVGVFIGGSGIEMVSEEEGKKEVLECQRAQ